MNPLLFIRLNIFKATQVEMAAVARVEQPTWSRWERGHRAPTYEQLRRIRAAALKRGLEWDDRWFFEADKPARRRKRAA